MKHNFPYNMFFRNITIIIYIWKDLKKFTKIILQFTFTYFLEIKSKSIHYIFFFRK